MAQLSAARLSQPLRQRTRAAALHLVLSAAVAAAASALVLALWYPTPFATISAGQQLLMLIVGIDIVVGPLITLAVFDVRKARTELVRDLSFVGVLQVAALLYGLYAAWQARPVIVALETDRLRVVRMIDIERADLLKAPAEFGTLAWTGPRFVATRMPSATEQFESIERALLGQDLGMRPEFWRPDYERAAAFANAALPLMQLSRRWPQHEAKLQRAVAATRVPAEQLGYLPILARRTDWSALVDKRDGTIVGYVDIDGF
jgi:hypothetical protein